MAEEVKSSAQDEIYQAYKDSVTKQTKQYMKNKSQYGELYAYVQAYKRVEQINPGLNGNVDAIHHYMIAHKAELGLPDSLASTLSLNTYYGWAVHYGDGQVCSLNKVKEAYGKYQSKTNFDHIDAIKARDDAQKALEEHNEKIEESKKKIRGKGWKKVLNYVLTGLTAIALVAAITVPAT